MGQGALSGFGARRRAVKAARDVLRHARHMRRMREDLLAPDVDAELRRLEAELSVSMKGRDPAAMESAAGALHDAVGKITPMRKHPGLTENLEVFVVAFAVAMCFRAYVIQPFKIPTGSMQPTLNGIRYHEAQDPGITHRMPLKLVRAVISGEWYSEVKAGASGTVSMYADRYTGKILISVGGRKAKCDREMRFHVRDGDWVKKGDVLASGIRGSGDHLFVNKIAWNFRKPRRGEIMVFRTDNIKELHEKKTHYIKRMVGLPGERVAVDPPNLIIDGEAIQTPESIRRIVQEDEHYAGYRLPMRMEPSALPGARIPFVLGEDEFFACGDNTGSSFDSRYWGAVPRENLVGPAVFVYWPVSSHWGFIRN